MRKIFTMTAVAAAIICSGFQTANAGLLGMPLNLHTAIGAAHTNPVAAPAPVYPRYVDEMSDFVIEC